MDEKLGHCCGGKNGGAGEKMNITHNAGLEVGLHHAANQWRLRESEPFFPLCSGNKKLPRKMIFLRSSFLL